MDYMHTYRVASCFIPEIETFLAVIVVIAD